MFLRNPERKEDGMGREGRDYWEAQLSEYWDSGLTIQEYSELKELPYESTRRWIRELQKIWKCITEIITIFIEKIDSNICFLGTVVGYDSENILLQALGTFSSRDSSELILRWKDITRIEVESLYLQDIKAILSRTKEWMILSWCPFERSKHDMKLWSWLNNLHR